MNNEEWALALKILRDESDLEKAGQAAVDFPKMVSQDDIPRLVEILGDNDFVIREIAAVALCELKAISFLEQILVALQKGFDDGHDNDSLQGSLWAMVGANKAAVKAKLSEIRNGADEKLIENIDWLMEFCE